MTESVTSEELDRLYSIAFIHEGCEMIRRKDVQYLLDQRDILQKRIDRALTVLAHTDDHGTTELARDILLGF